VILGDNVEGCAEPPGKPLGATSLDIEGAVADREAVVQPLGTGVPSSRSNLFASLDRFPRHRLLGIIAAPRKLYIFVRHSRPSISPTRIARQCR
jgi:hypothetical protein